MDSALRTVIWRLHSIDLEQLSANSRITVRCMSSAGTSRKFDSIAYNQAHAGTRAARPPAEGPPGRSALRRCGLPVTSVFTNMLLRTIEQAPS